MNACRAESLLTERIPFQQDQSTDCRMEVSKVMVISCPERYFVYNTDLFVRTGNKGARDFGSNGKLVGVH